MNFSEHFAGVPEILKSQRRWLLWRYEERARRATKVPYQVSGAPASSTGTSTWTSFDEAVAAVQNTDRGGIGIALGDGLVGVDFDHVRDPETGRIEPWVERLMGRLQSYSEVSPSGTGIHVICRGELPQGSRKFTDLRVEMYDSGRYFTVTGHPSWAVADQSLHVPVHYLGQGVLLFKPCFETVVE